MEVGKQNAEGGLRGRQGQDLSVPLLQALLQFLKNCFSPLQWLIRVITGLQKSTASRNL